MGLASWYSLDVGPVYQERFKRDCDVEGQDLNGLEWMYFDWTSDPSEPDAKKRKLDDNDIWTVGEFKLISDEIETAMRELFVRLAKHMSESDPVKVVDVTDEVAFSIFSEAILISVAFYDEEIPFMYAPEGDMAQLGHDPSAPGFYATLLSGAGAVTPYFIHEDVCGPSEYANRRIQDRDTVVFPTEFDAATALPTPGAISGSDRGAAGGRWHHAHLGISAPYMIHSSPLGTPGFHVEQCALASANLLHTGAKRWLATDGSLATLDKLVRLMKVLGTDGRVRRDTRAVVGLLTQKEMYICLTEKAVKELNMMTFLQLPGDIVVTRASVIPHQTMSVGGTVAEAVNFTPHGDGEFDAAKAHCDEFKRYLGFAKRQFNAAKAAAKPRHVKAIQALEEKDVQKNWTDCERLMDEYLLCNRRE